MGYGGAAVVSAAAAAVEDITHPILTAALFCSSY